MLVLDIQAERGSCGLVVLPYHRQLECICARFMVKQLERCRLFHCGCRSGSTDVTQFDRICGESRSAPSNQKSGAVVVLLVQFCA